MNTPSEIHRALFLLLVVLGVGALVLGILGTGSMPIYEQSVASLSDDHMVLDVGDSRIRAIPAFTEDARAKGLSGYALIPENEGMLFMYGTPDLYEFWMRGMLFSIDIIWINAERNVVGINRDVSPSTYPAIFVPPSPVMYVLEVPAGWAEAHAVRVGTSVAF